MEILRRIVVVDVDWRFDNLSGSHLKSEAYSEGCQYSGYTADSQQQHQQSFSELHQAWTIFIYKHLTIL